jgi:adenylate kinase
MVALVRQRLARPDAVNGYILDGFPRTVQQARVLDDMVNGKTLIVVDLAVPDDELLQRMQGRRVCSQCAWIGYPGAASKDTCERCGGKMVTRADDGDENVRRRRLEVYVQESKPLLDYYRDRPTFRSINGAQAPDCVAADLVASIDALAPVQSGRRP